MNNSYDTAIEYSQTDLSFFNKAVDSMMNDMKQILNSKSISPIEKIFSFVRYQCFELIKLFNIFKNSLSENQEFDFFIEYNFLVSQKIKIIYFQLFDECIKNLLIDPAINRELIFDTIQDIIIYFTEIYYETKKIGVSITYLEDAVKLLLQGLMVPKPVLQ